MIHNTPTDIVYHICNWLPLVDIIRLKNTNRTLRNKVSSIEKYIITRQLRFSDAKITSDDILKNDVYRQIATGKQIASNPIINRMFWRVIADTREQNVFERYILYNLLTIDSKTYDNLSNIMEFIEEFAPDPVRTPTALNASVQSFYIHVLTVHPILSFKILNQISKRIVTLRMLSQLWGTYKLDLRSSQLLGEYDNSLNELIDYKYNMPCDNMLTTNYASIKELLLKQRPDIYEKMSSMERIKVNKNIFFLDPYTNKSTCLHSKASQRLFHKLYFEEPYTPSIDSYKRQLNTYIRKKQHALLQFHFGTFDA